MILHIIYLHNQNWQKSAGYKYDARESGHACALKRMIAGSTTVIVEDFMLSELN